MRGRLTMGWVIPGDISRGMGYPKGRVSGGGLYPPPYHKTGGTHPNGMLSVY